MPAWLPNESRAQELVTGIRDKSRLARRIDIQDLFADTSHHVEVIQAGGKSLTDDRVAALVQTMSTMSQPATSIASLTSTQQAQLQSALATAWQG